MAPAPALKQQGSAAALLRYGVGALLLWGVRLFPFVVLLSSDSAG